MRYCTNCIYPETRPGISFNDEGICNYCRCFKSLDKIDWKTRKDHLREIAEEAKSKKAQYDCVVGVSGGKDSTYMALYARDILGLRVLLANMVPDGITDIGYHNLDNLQRMGFDTFMFRPNPKVCKNLARMAFFKYGNPVKPSEYCLYATPIRAAFFYKVPLLMFDNDWTFLDDAEQDKSGGDASNINNCYTLGWSGDSSHLLCDGVTEQDLQPYQYPSQEEIKQHGLKMFYLGYFERWSTRVHADFAIKRGLKIRTDDLEDIGRYTRFHALDDDTGIVNQMIKHVKLGFGFATEEACMDIWDGRITREEGIALAQKYDGKCATRYITDFCTYIGINLDEFWNVVESFRGPMWEKNSRGEWVLKSPIGQSS